VNKDHPLSGKRIVVTRPAGQAAPFIDKIEKAGGTAYAVPLIAFRMCEDSQDETILNQLRTYDWIILTSKNGVDFFMKKAGAYVKQLPAKFAAIGTKTAKAIEAYGVMVSYIPERFSADDLAEEMKQGLFLPEKALIPKGNLSRSLIGDTIRRSGKEADDWIVYETYFPEEEKAKLLHLIRHEQIDMYTFTSPSAVRHFIHTLNESHEPIPKADFACIGPVTKKEAEKYGMTISICPDEYTIDSLVCDMSHYYKE
jgi:uroporphyrinogen-III synthase